ncbi:hypothetical protein GCG54_00008281 [Colletotrichum gloeosporioides]|uniref:NACHT domain-containing protein n=1 Tax=Colletotrichum gloeosporioides TaxID=474922 RepID=A0A8H4C7F0_COLGL|nr:uncharacterized protein GCG54_00008281 [Colletotrichum gloeosporioides]KAF3798823.1 hypothetical protein GCG54_00008281 [Colletotrichum gloeosporioides]
MAELAAIGLASNLLQFAELGVKLFRLARESYESGSTAQYEALRDQARSVQDQEQQDASWSLKNLCLQSERLEARTSDTLKEIMEKVKEIVKSLKNKEEEWAGENHIAIANHFFWISGNSMQKSRQGLLQTLLYKVLKEVPGLIESVCGSRWRNSSHGFIEPWDEAELSQALYMLTSTTRLPVSFCFFIDGLDEYTAGAKKYHGTFEDLFQILYKLASIPCVKICVSSRPWTQFTESLGPKVEEWQLRIEDLSGGDIENYVMATLGSNPYYKQLAERDFRCHQIAKTIVQRAQGVFLWVYLVVKSLQNGLVHEDTYEELQYRLEYLPGDLDDFFQHMIESIEDVYWDNSYRYFKIMIEADQAIPLLAFEFLDWEAKSPQYGPQYAMRMKVEVFSEEQLQSTYERVRKRVHARCNDLLHIEKSSVNFFHRTARDFCIDTGAIDRMVKKRVTTEFNPSLSLCKIMLALVKSLGDSVLHGDGLMHFARRVEEQFHEDILKKANSPQRAQEDLRVSFDLLDELDRSVGQMFRELEPTPSKQPKRQGVHWVNFRHSNEVGFRDPTGKTFLAASIQAGLSLYVESKIMEDPSQIKSKSGRPLLDYSLRRTMSNAWLSRSTGLEGPISSIVKLLLENGADPNEKMSPQIGEIGIKTPWEHFLQGCYDHASRVPDTDLHEEEIAETMISMIDHGADRNALAWAESDGAREADIPEVARMSGLSDYDVNRVESSLENAQAREQKKNQENERPTLHLNIFAVLLSLWWLEKKDRRAAYMRLLVGLWNLVWWPRR